MKTKSRLKRIADAVLKHIHSNAAIYLTTFGALYQHDQLTTIACLKLLLLRAVIGAIRNRLSAKKETDDQNKK